MTEMGRKRCMIDKKMEKEMNDRNGRERERIDGWMDRQMVIDRGEER